MVARTNLNVSLTPELEQFVHERVSTGRFQTPSEVIREGLRLLELRERERETEFLALKRKLEHAAGQADRGEFVDPQEVLQEIEIRKRQRAAERS